jgi:serine/threonine protein phosphatase PrpC
MIQNKLIQSAIPILSKGTRLIQEDVATVSIDKGVFAVADGFGGGEVGCEAAQTASDALREFLEKEAGDLEATLPFVLRSYYSLPANVLFNALIYANRKILELNHDKNIHEKGGTSLLAAFVDADLIALASVGSCSAWLLREGVGKEIVRAKSYGRFLDPCLVERTDAFAVPLAALGMVEDLEPEITEVRFKPRDWLLLHTDGLTEEMLNSITQSQLDLGLSPVTQDRLQILQVQIQKTAHGDNCAISLICF